MESVPYCVAAGEIEQVRFKFKFMCNINVARASAYILSHAGGIFGLRFNVV